MSTKTNGQRGRAKNDQKKKNLKSSQQLVKKKVHQPDFQFAADLFKAIMAVKISKVGETNLHLYRLSDPTLKNIKVTRKDIPFWNSRFHKGTQAPTIRLYLNPQTIASSAGGTNVNTVQFNGTNLLNFSDLVNVFDEYRVISGMAQYDADTGLTASKSVQLSNGVIDYGDTNALTTFAEAEAYDTKKKYYSVPYVVDVKPKSVKWPIHFERLPDQEWTPTATTTTFASWKTYSFNNTANSLTLGVLTGYVDVQFRGSD